MKRIASYVLLPLTVILLTAFVIKKHQNPAEQRNTYIHPKSKAKIQAAILLDVSNSMDGLINQAKLQLWNMVSVMGRGKCDGETPDIELALYEYGRSDNEISKGYVKQLAAFTTNLDSLSNILFGLTTNGGDEFCGQVIYTSLNDLTWDTNPATYKVIFIAGNEDFLQGNLQYTKACSLAKNKSVVVNTIYCGPREQGIREHWNLNDECGSGSFSNINQNASMEEIPTPYDTVLLALNSSLNATYMWFGSDGLTAGMQVQEVDAKTANVNQAAAIKRIEVKGNSKVYRNAAADLVDASKENKNFISKMDKSMLPDSLKNKSTAELEKIIKEKSSAREAIQRQIIEISSKRNAYIDQQRKQNAGKQEQTLETEIEKIIRKQAKNYRIVID
jgi:hypothetical protein